jgi:aspartate ammonia-lyase
MKPTNTKDFIKEVELFKEFTKSEAAEFSRLFEEKEYKSGDYLFKENYDRKNIFLVVEGEVELFKTSAFGKENRITLFTKFDFLGEASLMEDAPHSTSARASKDSIILAAECEAVRKLLNENGKIAVKVYSKVSQVVSRRMSNFNARLINMAAIYVSGKTRTEHDLLGERNIPDEFYYGIQTMRGRENFNITGITLSFYPTIITAFAMVKKAAALANFELGLLPKEITDAVIEACNRIINGHYHSQFIVDMIQGGAGTSTNMNANEVIANVALEIMGKRKGDYQFCHPNNHVNLSQSTNDAYPTAVKIALILSNKSLVEVLSSLVDSFRAKASEFKDVIKMGRTQLQDAVPMTLGQEFEAYGYSLFEEIARLENHAKSMLSINMGATAIGTGINSEPGYAEKVTKYLKKVSGLDTELADNLVEATQDTSSFIMFSSALKRLAIKLSKISNDLRLLSSGPRCGLNEINLPPMQPGSSIMPGKVNPVIPEVVNQIAFKVIGNDLTVSLAAEAGQLELNVMEPVIVQSLFESLEMLKNGMTVLEHRCISGITANVEHCRTMVHNSIGIVTALNPVLGYEISTQIAKEAMETGRGVYELVLEKNLLTKQEIDEILSPEKMISPHKFIKK